MHTICSCKRESNKLAFITAVALQTYSRYSYEISENYVHR